MFRWLPPPLAASLALVLLFVHTCLCAVAILSLAPVKVLLLPFHIDHKLLWLYRAPYHYWYRAFPFFFRLFGRLKFSIRMPEERIDLQETGLIIANHQSWLDILVITGALGRKIPSPSFFLKQELIWIPFFGTPCWVMDHIFVRRYSQKELNQNPSLRGKDIANAKEKCLKLKDFPTTVINFVEGTRKTALKYEKSPKHYKHLLPAKAGGINFALNAFGPKVRYVLDISLVYHTEDRDRIMWQLLTGRIQKIDMHIRRLPWNLDLLGDYENDAEYRHRFQTWLNQAWQEKDAIIDRLEKSYSAGRENSAPR